MLIKNIANTLRFVRSINGDDLRVIAQDYADDVLGRYGYYRGPSTAMRVLSMAGAFGAGVAVGTGLGLIFAPRSGAETRQAISRTVENGVNRVKETVQRQRGNGHRIVTDAEEIRHARPGH
jgi:hypothetical protein